MIERLHEHCFSMMPYQAIVEAARSGQLRVLQWLTEYHQHAVWIPQIMDAAASTNQLYVLQWLHEQPKNGGCTSKAFSSAVENGHLDAAKWLQEHCPSVITNPYFDVLEAIGKGHAEVVKYIYEQPRFCLSFTKGIKRAAEMGDLSLIQWLLARSTECYNSRAIDSAAGGGHLNVVQWLHDHFPSAIPRIPITNAALRGHLNVVH